MSRRALHVPDGSERAVVRSTSRGVRAPLPRVDLDRPVLLPGDAEALVDYAEWSARTARFGYAHRALRQALQMAREADAPVIIEALTRAEETASAVREGRAPWAALVELLQAILASSQASTLRELRPSARGDSL